MSVYKGKFTARVSITKDSIADIGLYSRLIAEINGLTIGSVNLLIGQRIRKEGPTYVVLPSLTSYTNSPLFPVFTVRGFLLFNNKSA